MGKFEFATFDMPTIEFATIEMMTFDNTFFKMKIDFTGESSQVECCV
jgi:hypothetical protein